MATDIKQKSLSGFVDESLESINGHSNSLPQSAEHLARSLGNHQIQ